MTEIATFGAGCFWHPQAEFNKIPGILKTTVGYMGGSVENPTYQMVCSNETGHVEVTQIEFDPKLISYEELLDLFWSMHDPTSVDRQGPDVGYQYKSVIFYHSEAQKKAAEKSMKALQKKLNTTIATVIRPAEAFYKAEGYHQNYLEKRKKPWKFLTG